MTPRDGRRNFLRLAGASALLTACRKSDAAPAVGKPGSAIAAVVNTLIAQHQRGREITAYVLAVTQSAINAERAHPLAEALERIRADVRGARGHRGHDRLSRMEESALASRA